MNILRLAAPIAALLLVACTPNPVRIVQPLPPSLQGAGQVADVEVAINPLAAPQMVRFEDKARDERQEAGLPPVPAEGLTARPPEEQYRTLPFAQMFELVVEDVTRAAGLTSGRAVRLAVEIDTLKTANAGMAILAGSNDQLSGTVTVLDALTGERLGEFYVDVINRHSGLFGLAIRGGGIRERLAEEFAGHIAAQLAPRQRRR